jgi:hypothetical protein
MEMNRGTLRFGKQVGAPDHFEHKNAHPRVSAGSGAGSCSGRAVVSAQFLPGNDRLPLFSGYIDRDRRHVSFIDAEEVFERARSIKLRTLLRLTLNEQGELEGLFYVNAGSVMR